MAVASNIFIPSIVGGLNIAVPAVTPPVSGANQIVTAACVDPSNGDVYFGGLFAQVNGIARSCLACVTRNGVLKAWNPGINSTGNINCMKFTGAGIYIGGFFNTIGATTAAGVALVDTSGAVMAFTTSATTTLNGLSAGNPICVDVDGNGNSYWGLNSNSTGFACYGLSPSGALVWIAQVTLSSSAVIWSIKINGGLVHVGGSFSQAKTYPSTAVTRNGLAQLKAYNGLADDGYATAWDANASVGANIRCIDFDSSTNLYIAGNFTTILGASCPAGFAAVSGPTPTKNTWSPGPAGIVGLIVAASGTDVYWATPYNTFHNSTGTAGKMGCMDSAGANHPWGIQTTLNPDASYNDIQCMVPDAANPTIGAVWVGGAFQCVMAGTIVRACLAKVAGRTQNPTYLAW